MYFNRGRTALHSAAFSGQTEVADMLMEDWDINAQDKRGTTPIMMCCWKNQLKTLRKFTEKHADANLQNKDGTTCLMIAGM